MISDKKNIIKLKVDLLFHRKKRYKKNKSRTPLLVTSASEIFRDGKAYPTMKLLLAIILGRGERGERNFGVEGDGGGVEGKWCKDGYDF